MRGFPQNAVCVVGLSKAPSQNPITFVHQSLIGSSKGTKTMQTMLMEGIRRRITFCKIWAFERSDIKEYVQPFKGDTIDTTFDKFSRFSVFV